MNPVVENDIEIYYGTMVERIIMSFKYTEWHMNTATDATMPFFTTG